MTNKIDELGLKRYEFCGYSEIDLSASAKEYEQDNGRYFKASDIEALLASGKLVVVEPVLKENETLKENVRYLEFLNFDLRFVNEDIRLAFKTVKNSKYIGMSYVGILEAIAKENDELVKKLDKAREALREIETLTDSSTIKHIAESALKEIE